MSLPMMLLDFSSGRWRRVFHSRVISALLPVRVYCCCTQPINPVGCIYETGHVCLERMVPGTWRVVFSSTGDLAPARGAAVFPLSGRMWVEAVRRPLRSVLDSIAVVLLPCDCRDCGRPLVRLSRIPVCDDCLQSLSPADVNACCVCGEALGRSWVNETHLLKCEQLRPAANVIGAKLAEATATRNLASETPILLVPVHLHVVKRRGRGFNQAETIARGAPRHLDRSRFEMHSGNLRRGVRHRVPDRTDVARAPRKRARAFVVGSPERLRDRIVLLIDDVYTTSTTLNECARVLRKAGAKPVIVATVARVYRQVVEIAPGGVPNREENAACLRRSGRRIGHR